jgi:hypothetical protein
MGVCVSTAVRKGAVIKIFSAVCSVSLNVPSGKNKNRDPSSNGSL